jgi:predicted DNA-binding protein YlxM (UPF0122 family)
MYFPMHDLSTASRLIEDAERILTRRQYQVFELYFLCGIKQALVADHLGLDRPAVNHLIQRIVSRMKNDNIFVTSIKG